MEDAPRSSEKKVLLAVLLVAAIALGIAIPMLVYGGIQLMSVVGIIVALWLAFAALIEPVERLRKGHSLSAGVLGMTVAHFGLALFILGVTDGRIVQDRKGPSAAAGSERRGRAASRSRMNSLRRRRRAELPGHRERSHDHARRQAS